MSFKDLKKSIENLKDIAEAPQLRERNKQLAEKLRGIDNQHERERQEWAAEKKVLTSSLESMRLENKKLKDLRIVFNKDSYSLKDINKFVDNRFNRKLKQQIVINASELSAKQLPSMVQAEIGNYPKNCSWETKAKIEEKAGQLQEDYLRNEAKWPPWFQAKVQQDAEKRAEKLKDEEFWAQVNHQTNYEVNQRLPYAWSRFLSGYAKSYTQNIIQTQLKQLTTTIDENCPRCGNQYQLTLTPDDLAQLVRVGRIDFKCPFCRGFLRSKIRLTLGQLFWKIMNGDTTPRIAFLGKPIKRKIDLARK